MRAWIARDEGGVAYIFCVKPQKVKWSNVWNVDYDQWFKVEESDLPEGINPQWSDDEPIEVELKIEKI